MANNFPSWTNSIPIKIIICIAITVALIAIIVPRYFTQQNTRVNYEPEQPIPFSHKIHAGDLGMDCRYCHSFVDKAPHANLPTASTCMNCHKLVKKTSPKLKPLFDAVEKGKPIAWTHIHKTPQYAYFDHSVHVNRGISCVECHGRIDQMEVVGQKKSMSMGFCIECHEKPENKLRPLKEIYNLGWEANSQNAEEFKNYMERNLGDDKNAIKKLHKLLKKNNINLENKDTKIKQKQIGNIIKEVWKVNPPQATNCGACHR